MRTDFPGGRIAEGRVSSCGVHHKMPSCFPERRCGPRLSPAAMGDAFALSAPLAGGTAGLYNASCSGGRAVVLHCGFSVELLDGYRLYGTKLYGTHM